MQCLVRGRAALCKTEQCACVYVCVSGSLCGRAAGTFAGPPKLSLPRACGCRSTSRAGPGTRWTAGASAPRSSRSSGPTSTAAGATRTRTRTNRTATSCCSTCVRTTSSSPQVRAQLTHTDTHTH